MRFLPAAFFLLYVSNTSRVVLAALACRSNQDCFQALRPESECVDGFCSNPFRKGCLRTMGIAVQVDPQGGLSVSHIETDNIVDLPMRVCNTDDRDEHYCDKNTDFQYPQVRIHNGNWESSIFFSWVLQILLMEVVRAPATVGLTTQTTAASSFYSPTNTLEYSAAAYPFFALRDARACEQHNKECAQVLPEVWNGQLNEWTKAANEGYIEPIEGNGQVGKGSWYVPKFTAVRDDSLVSFYGLSGESNRRKLAEAFLKPTSWLDYCQLVSSNNCSTPDAVAAYFPSEEEHNKYFDQVSFTGYFRVTPENNCTINPDTCMGHIVGPGCTWSTNVDAQLYWNDIQLKPDGPLQPNGGYEYSSLIEIWRAANATKSNIVFWWWRPEALVEEFYGTESQFQQVLLPEATDICSRARVDTDARCSEDIMERRGDPEGACDQEAHALQKIVSKAFADETFSQPLVSRSPSYDLIKAVKITDLEINHMLRRWIALGVDPYGNDARETVCGWVVENIDQLLDYIPAGYPKMLSEQSTYQSPFLHTAMAIGIVATFYILVMARLAYYWRNTKVFVYAQAHLVYLILFGFLLIALGAVVTSLTPSDAVCITRIWLVNLGYTIELVPLLVKIAAINRILAAANKLKRVRISRQAMFRQVGIIIALVATFLLVWTIVDPSKAVEERELPDPQGFVVETTLTCASEEGFWTVIALGWQALLLFIATVLAFQSRDVAQDFNESQRLGTMIYSHMIFLVLRGIIALLGGGGQTFEPNIVAGIMSLLLSLDTVFANIIYFLPKCLEAKAKPENYFSNPGSSRSSAAVTAIEKKAAIANSSHQSNSSKASMIDATGTMIHISHGKGSARRRNQNFGGKPESNSVAFAHTGSLSQRGIASRQRTANSLTELREVSQESSDNDMSSSFKKSASVGCNVVRESSEQDMIAGHHIAEASLGSSAGMPAETNYLELNVEQSPLSSAEQAPEHGGIEPQRVTDGLHSTPIIRDRVTKGRLSGNNDSESDDYSSSSESLDNGGPRFNNDKANAELERSVQVFSHFE